MSAAETRLGSYDPALVEAVREGEAEEELSVVARLAGTDALPEGVRIVTRFGDVATLRLSRGRLAELADCESVIAVEAARRLRQSADFEDGGDDSAWPDGEEDEEDVETLHDAFPETARYDRRPEGLGTTGRGVALGVLDWGCDFAHPAFRKADGSTRLLAIWDQRGRDGTGRGNRWGYGRILTGEAIDRALRAEDPYRALDYHPGDSDKRSRGRWKGAHGTHVLDIAGGNGRGGGMSGVAPEADLVFVHLARTTRVLGRGNLGDSASVLEALDFVFSIAGERPCVINMSVGAHGGPHDGSTLVEQGIDRAVSLAAGRVVTNSAGNYFASRAHLQGRLKQGEEEIIRFSVPSRDPTESELEVWYPGVDRLTAVVSGPGERELARVRPGQDAGLTVAGKRVGHVYHRVSHATNGDHHIDLFLRPRAPAGLWTMRLGAERVRDGNYHAWIERDRGKRPKFLPSEVVTSSTTGTLCNGRLSITVGAYDPHAGGGVLGSFSSSGPTRDGRVKPEIVAPGVRIRAARSTPPGAEPGARHVAKSGTSMAAPHIAGCAALILEAAGKSLEAADLRALLFASASRAPFASTPPAGVDLHRYGVGCLDIAEAERVAREWSRDGAEQVGQPDLEDPLPPDALEEEAETTEPVEDIAEESNSPDRAPLIDARWTIVGPAVSETSESTEGDLVPPRLNELTADEAVRAGDLLLRTLPAEGVRYSALVVSERLESAAELAERGVPVERAGPGGYLEVLETPWGSGAQRSVGRRLTDAWGCRLRGQNLLRAAEGSAAARPAKTLPGDSVALGEAVTIDDVAAEMDGLKCKVLEDVATTRADGTARTFVKDSVQDIESWNGTAAEATIDGSAVSKLAIEPEFASVATVRLYDLPLGGQRRSVRRNELQLSTWLGRQPEFRKNRRHWEKEKRRLEDLLAKRRKIYSRMWVRRMMYNRFDGDIDRWTGHYNTLLSPSSDLDPNVVKSILYQESRMGTSGQHLMPPPSDWSSGSRHPIRSRFNIGQAIDSWGPQQWLMMREMAPAIFSRHRLDELAPQGRWLGMSASDYSSHATFMTALREFFEHRSGGDNLMGTPGRDLHEDYGFWIRTAIRWLIHKFQRLKSPTWREAVRAYNGSGARARRYRDTVMARVGSTDPLAITEEAEESECWEGRLVA